MTRKEGQRKISATYRKGISSDENVQKMTQDEAGRDMTPSQAEIAGPSDHWESNNDEFEQLLRSSLDELDRLANPAAPPMAWFQQFAEDQQRARRQRFKREVFGFLCVAPFAIGSTMLSMTYGIEAFIGFQVLTIAILAIPVLRRKNKRADSS